MTSQKPSDHFIVNMFFWKSKKEEIPITKTLKTRIREYRHTRTLLKKIKPGDLVFPAQDGKFLRMTPCRAISRYKSTILVQGLFDGGDDENEIITFDQWGKAIDANYTLCTLQMLMHVKDYLNPDYVNALINGDLDYFRKKLSSSTLDS